MMYRLNTFIHDACCTRAHDVIEVMPTTVADMQKIASEAAAAKTCKLCPVADGQPRNLGCQYHALV